MITHTDGSGNLYIESSLSNNEAVRVTFVEEGWTDGNCIRINIRQTNNLVRPGPEIPIENIAEVSAAIVELSKKDN